jgi:hypothetical protein
VIYIRRVWFPNAACDCFKQSVISIRGFWHAKMWLRHFKLSFQHAECDVETYECDYDTHESDYDTYHSWKYGNHICACQNPRIEINNHTLRVEITLCVWKSHFAFRNYTRTCVHHSMRVNITQEWFLHAECGFDTYECHNHFRECHNVMRVMRVNIALCVYESHSCVLISHSCVLISHFAFQNYIRACNYHTMRLDITLCV